jgi:hypothetical protein
MENKRFVAAIGIVVVVLLIGAFFALMLPAGSHHTTSTGTAASSTATTSSSSTGTSISSLTTSTTTSFPSFSFTFSSTSAISTVQTSTTSSLSTSSTSASTTSTVQYTTTTYGSNAALSCFTNLNETSVTQFVVNNETAYRIEFLNATGTSVVAYVLPAVEATLASGDSTGYSFSFSGNSTFTGMYFYADFSGSLPLTGFAGIPDSSSYHTFSSGTSNSTSIRYLVSQGLSVPYEIGVENTSGSTQTITGGTVIVATCGVSWVSQVSVI